MKTIKAAGGTLALFLAGIWCFHLAPEVVVSTGNFAPAIQPQHVASKASSASIKRSSDPVSTASITGKQNIAANKPEAPEHGQFSDWTTRYLNADPQQKPALIKEGVTLAKARRTVLATLIQSDPEKAIAAAIPVTMRNQLPAEVLPLLEERVSRRGDLIAIAVTPAPNQPVSKTVMHVADFGDKYYYAHIYGKRQALTTTRKTGIHGIAIDNQLAVLDSPLRVIEPGEDLSKKPISNVCPVSKKKTYIPLSAIASDNLIAVDDGEEIITLCSPDHINTYEQQLAAQGGVVLGDSGPGTSTSNYRPDISWTHGNKRILVMRVDFSDLPGTPVDYTWDLITDQLVYDRFHGSGGVSDFYKENSFNKTDTVVAAPINGDSPDVPPVARMSMSAQQYQQSGGPWVVYAEAISAAKASGVDVDMYDRHIVVHSRFDFAWGGRAQIYGKVIWLNGSIDTRLIIHELGHTYGLGHSNLWHVPDGNPVSLNGNSREYGDLYDPMGSGDLNHHFNHYQKNILRWIPDEAIQTVSSSGTYRIHRFDHKDAVLTNKLGIKIVRNATNDFWIGYRRKTVDSSLQHGANVLLGWNNQYDPSLLDMAQFDGFMQGVEPGLMLNQDFYDGATNIWFKPIARGGTEADEWLDVRVSLNGPLGGRPTISFLAAESDTLFRIGQPITVAATATDSQGRALQPSAFSWKIQRLESGHHSSFPFHGSGSTSVEYFVPTGDFVSDKTMFRFVLTVTDSTPDPISASAAYDVWPMVVPVNLSSNVPGMRVNVDGTDFLLGQISLDREVGKQVQVAPLEHWNNSQGHYSWVGWAHGGDRVQNLSVRSLREGPNDFRVLYQETGLKAEYFNNTSLQGSPVLTRFESVVKYESTVPIPGVNTTHIAVRWSGYLTAPITGTYAFQTLTDDGVRLWINGSQVIDDWTLHAPLYNTGYAYLNSNKLIPFVMEYHQAYESGRAELKWTGPAYQGNFTSITPSLFLNPHTDSSGTGLKAEYFNNETLSGTPVLVRTDAQVNYSDSQSIPGVNSDLISIRWSGEIQIPADGNYSFHAFSDDGARLWVNNVPLINDWTTHPPLENTATTYLSQGCYPIVMEYFERDGGATAQLSWSGPGISKQLIPANRLFPSDLDRGKPLDANLDTDGDGMSDLAELKFGSDPADPSFRVSVSSRTRSSGKKAISFSSVAGNKYQLQSCDNLGPNAVWSPVILDLGAGTTGTSLIAHETTTELTDNTAPAALPTRRFYRVIAP